MYWLMYDVLVLMRKVLVAKVISQSDLTGCELNEWKEIRTTRIIIAVIIIDLVFIHSKRIQ